MEDPPESRVWGPECIHAIYRRTYLLTIIFEILNFKQLTSFCMALILKSQAFENNGVIPRKYGYKNGNSTPPLTISGVPEDTASLVLIMDDPDAMGAVGKVWTHWVLWNISPQPLIEFQEDSIPSCMEGKTDFGTVGYGGPAPPDKEHTYIFKLYALDKMLSLPKGSTKSDVEEAASNHILAQTTLKGRYSP